MLVPGPARELPTPSPAGHYACIVDGVAVHQGAACVGAHTWPSAGAVPVGSCRVHRAVAVCTMLQGHSVCSHQHRGTCPGRMRGGGLQRRSRAGRQHGALPPTRIHGRLLRAKYRIVAMVLTLRRLCRTGKDVQVGPTCPACRESQNTRIQSHCAGLVTAHDSAVPTT